MSDILWPDHYIPGFTDNFCSNEVIAAGLTSAEIWPLLARPHAWPGYYKNSSDIEIRGGGEELTLGSRFFFRTFGFPVDAEVVEFRAPAPGQAARIAWHGWAGDGDDRLDVHHAWLIEDLSAGRVRILTQETQNGAPARALAAARPNPMINGHQEWLDGLLEAARGAKA